MAGIPEGFERVERAGKESGVQAKFKKTDEGVQGSVSIDPDSYTTFTKDEGTDNFKNAYNRKSYLPCEFGSPNGAHSDSGAATHLVYLNGGPSEDPLEVPRAACAHHEVKLRERAASLNPDTAPLFRPIINQRMVAEHRAAKDKINKDLTLSLEAGLQKAGVQPGTPEALWGRSTPDFYNRGKIPVSNPALEAAKQRRGNAKLYRIKGGKHSGKIIAANPEDVESGLDIILSRSFGEEGGGRAPNAPEGFVSANPKSPFRYKFKTRSKKITPLESGAELPIEQRGTKQKVAHVFGMRKSGIPEAMWRLEAHRLGVHSEVESLLNTHTQPFTVDESGTIKFGTRPKRSRETVDVGTRKEVVAQLPPDKAEFDVTSGENIPLTPIESFTSRQLETQNEESDVEARIAATAERLRKIEARKRAIRGGRPGLRGELDKGTSKE
jgi:hypothetical protein